jgi:hypothetical protein
MLVLGKKVAVIVLVILITAGTAVYCFYPRADTYTFYGTKIITTTASSAQVSIILHQTARELGDAIVREGWGKNLPSSHQGSKNRKDDDSKSTAGWNITEFDDKYGNHCIIETVAIPGRQKVILLKSETDATTKMLANELKRQFRLHKIEHKE